MFHIFILTLRIRQKMRLIKLQLFTVNTDFKVDFNKIHNSYSMPKNNFIKKIYSIVWIRKTLSLLFPANLLRYIKTILFYESNKPKLSERTRELLYKYYLSDIENLEDLLSINLSQWKIGLVTITYNSRCNKRIS